MMNITIFIKQIIFLLDFYYKVISSDASISIYYITHCYVGHINPNWDFLSAGRFQSISCSLDYILS